jgi:hypothetical protein
MSVLLKTIDNSCVILFREGERVFIDHPHPRDVVPDEFGNFAKEVRRNTWEFHRNTIILGYSYATASDEQLARVDYVRHVRTYRPEANGLAHPEFDMIKPGSPRNTKLRLILKHKLNIPTKHVRGGFRSVLVYDDEIAVPAYGTSGARGWILEKKDLPVLETVLPRLRPSKERVDVEFCFTGYIPREEEPGRILPSYRNFQIWPTAAPGQCEDCLYWQMFGQPTRHQHYKATLNMGSHTLEKIFDPDGNRTEIATLELGDSFRAFTFQAGRNLPTWLIEEIRQAISQHRAVSYH